MAFGSIGERLALIIDADASGAIRAIKKVGDESQQQFSRAQTSQEKWSKGLLTGGAAAVGVAAVVGKGLLSTVHAYQGYEDAELKLQNTEKRMPQLAGASSKAFNDLADKISRTTEVDRDGVLAGEALLGTFGLTQQQILTLTPLIVDFSQKTGVNLNTAFRLVGKTVETGTNGLLRQGIVFDKTKLQADAFGTVVQGLSQKVGGFATEQGKTFEGRLGILRNQLHDLAEGVGKGATEQLGSMLGTVSGLTTGFGHLSTGTQDAIGRIGVIGTTGVAAAGGVALLGGAVLKLKDVMTVAEGETGVFGTSLTGLGFAGVVAGAASAALGLYAYGKQANATKVDVESLARATDHQLVAAWEAGREKFAAFMGTVGAKKQDLKLFQMLAEQNVGTAARLRDGLAKAGYSVAGYDKILRSAAKGQAQANQDQQTGADIVQRYGNNVGTAAGQVKTITDRLHDYRDAVDQATEKTLDVDDAERHLHDALRAQVSALLDVTDKAAALAAVRKDKKSTTEDITRAELDYYSALDNVNQSSDDAKRAVLDLAVKQAGASSTADAVSKHTDSYVAALVKVALTLAPNSPLRQWLQGYIDQLHTVPSTVTTHFDTTGGNAGGTHAGGLRHFASGGSLGPGEVGVAGDVRPGQAELLVQGGAGGARVYNPSDTAQMLTGGQHLHFHLHVSPTLGADAGRFAREFGDMWARDVRANGPITLAFRKALKVA